MKNILFITFVLLSILGCDKIVTPDFVADRKLVLSTFLSPQDTVHRFLLTYSSPVSAGIQQEVYVTNAQIELTDGTNAEWAVYNFTNNLYEIDSALFPIHAGVAYTVNVIHPEGILKGSTTIPLENNSLIVDTTKIGEEPLVYTDYQIKMRWETRPDNAAGYRIFAEDELKYTINGNYFTSYNLIVTSQNMNGVKYTLYDAGLPQYEHQVNYRYQISDVYEKTFLVSLLATDINYLSYHKSLLNIITDDPFAEPKHTFSNVEGGLGIVASYNRYLLKIPY